MLLVLAYILLGIMTIVSAMLMKTYRNLSQLELKRRARRGDEVANMLYRAAAYGSSLQILLWIIAGLSTAGFFVVLSQHLPSWLAFIAGLGLLWLAFAWIPYTTTNKINIWIAQRTAPPLAWLLRHLYPILSRIARSTRRWRVDFHTGLYEKEDLLDLLDQQQSQPDNRLSKTELSIAKNALTFGDKIIRDIMTPKNMAKMVSSDDQIGPLLMDELHDSGHSRFPVYEGKNQNRIIGTLYLRDVLGTPAGGSVKELMDKKVYYMHDEELLDESLQAFLKTRHHLFVVVNSFEDVVGIIALEDVLEQIVGKPIVDEFDTYDDLRAVASKKAAAEHHQHQEAATEIPPEVVESE